MRVGAQREPARRYVTSAISIIFRVKLGGIKSLYGYAGYSPIHSNRQHIDPLGAPGRSMLKSIPIQHSIFMPKREMG